MSNCRKAIIFGETSLVISCMQHILDRGWDISCVVSKDINVITWCQKNQIRILGVNEVGQINQQYCYLFSIINPYVISSELLDYIRPIRAINYHDSLLPRYAGLNSTTWSLLNSESTHGISWHELVVRIDEGCIFYQEEIVIESNETAFSLNMKCTEIALKGFIEIISKIENDNLIGRPQLLLERSYFGRDKIPNNYGYITDNTDISYINKLLNSLYMGSGYNNPVATVKVRIGSEYYILEKVNVNDYLNILNSTNCVLRNMYGNKSALDFNPEMILPFKLSNNELTYFSKLRQREFKIYSELGSLLDHVSNVTGLLNYVEFSGIVHDSEIKLENISVCELGLFLTIVLTRLVIGEEQSFIKVYNSSQIESSDVIIATTENISILAIDVKNLGLFYGEMTDNIRISLNQQFIIAKDFWYRYNLNSASEFAIVEGNLLNIDNHRIIFNVMGTSTVVKYSKKDAEFVNMLIKCINVLHSSINASTKSENIYIKNLPLLSETDYNNVVYEWNKTEAPYPNDKTIHGLFEEQVLITPDNIAVVYEDTKLTYSQLNQKANQLAHYLRKNFDIKGDDLIALCLDRSEIMIIAILGILKSGGAYLPISPDCPKERIRHMLNESNTNVIITNKSHADKVHIGNISVLDIDEKLVINEINLENKSNIEIYNPHKLAYVIYTSGTVGNPKGVLVEHRGVINTIYSLLTIYDSASELKITSFCNYIFDVFVAEILVALFCGHELHVLSEQVKRDTKLISQYINKQMINYMYLPPIMLAELPRIKYHTLKGIIYAGEPCDYNTALYWSTECMLYNYYGPTESTIYSTGLRIKDGNSSLIGKPLNNVQAYVLDKWLSILPIGAIGELYLAGDGVARGYLNNFELNKKKFIQNPFYIESSRNYKMYATGDLVRWTIDGTIEYLGRNDQQVKIRGCRVELSEIECLLNKCIGVKQSIVLVMSANADVNNKYLVAYYVSDSELNNNELIEQLSVSLPQYMLPNAFIQIPNIPQTVNGKLNKLALPSLLVGLDKYVVPKNELEQIICKEFANVLSVPVQQIGANHDFFKLGGNSLLVIRLVTRLKQQDLNIAVDDVFKLRTPNKVAKQVKHTKGYLIWQLNMVKCMYDRLNSHASRDLMSVNKRKELYLKQTESIGFSSSRKQIKNVLLTGSTGYLGSNILYQLLTTTEYSVYLLIRGRSNEDCYNRVKNKFGNYFEQNLDDYKDRIKVFASDIELTNMRLDDSSYSELVGNVDSILHVAALVRHYGDSNLFNLMNVQSTANLLVLSSKTKLKDFHYVSTISVLSDGYIRNCTYTCFSEDDDARFLVRGQNLYCQTKYEAEQLVVHYRQSGINANIYRVGNLAMHSKNYKVQENIDDNAFFVRMKTMLNLGMMPKELSQVEISPVDHTALAIVKLFDQEMLNNQVYHVFNPYKANLYRLLANRKDTKIIQVPFEEFSDTILRHLDLNEEKEQIELFMLHQGWLQDIDLSCITYFEFLQDKTESILSKLGFTWKPITSDMFSGIINESFKRKTEMTEHEQMSKHLNYITNMVPSTVYWLDHDFRFLGINQAGIVANGASGVEDFVGKTLQEVYPSHIAYKLMADFNEVVASQIEIHSEYVIEDFTTSKVKYFTANIAPLYDLSGSKNLGIIVSAIDITEKKDAEKLSEQQRIFNFLELIAETVPAAFYWSTVDGRFVGVNNLCLAAISAPNKDYIIGKTPYQLYQNKDIAYKLMEEIYNVLETGQMSQVEDKVIDINGKFRYFMATRLPLRNSFGEIIGIVGTSIEMTAQKEAERLSERQQIFNYVESIAETVPAVFYWYNEYGKYVGVNEMFLKSVGAPNKDYVIGKTVSEFYNDEVGNTLGRDVEEVIKTGTMSQMEDEIIDVTTGKTKYYMATRVPLRTPSGEIIGVMGTSIEITAQKEKEQLERENALQRVKAEEHVKLHGIVRQMVHDVRSPIQIITAILNNMADQIPENIRVSLRTSALGLLRSTEYVMAKFDDINAADERRQPFAVAMSLEQIVREKTYEYRALDVEITYFDETLRYAPKGGKGSDFAFITVQPTPFKRMMSNVINNAVEALDGKEDGKVIVSCYVDNEWVSISVKDNGKGMTKEQIENIQSGVVFSYGKENGHGIGTTQIRETIANNHGDFFINSTQGGKRSGSTFVIKFPVTEKPNWVADEIKVMANDTIIVLDDDPTIHDVWDDKFAPILEKDSTIQIKHFTQGSEVIEAIKDLSVADKDKICILSDFELVGQNGLTGLDVILACGCNRATLVTSHYGEDKITELVVNNRIRLLPKDLAKAVTITLSNAVKLGSRVVDLVWLDDEVHITNMARENYKHLKIDIYNDPVTFMQEVMQYPLDTRIVLDNQYYSYDLKCEWNGLKIAQELHSRQFTDIILVSGEQPLNKPDYLKVVIKGDMDAVNSIDKLSE